MYLSFGVIFTLGLIIFILFEKLKEQKKEAEAWKNNGNFCKKLLDRERKKNNK